MITIDFGKSGVSQLHVVGVDDAYAGAIAEYLKELLEVAEIGRPPGRLTNFRHEGGQHVIVRVYCTPDQVMPFATRVEEMFYRNRVWGLPERVREIYQTMRLQAGQA